MLIALFVHFGSSHALPCLTIGPVCWSLDGMPRLKSVAKIRNDRQSVVWFQVWNHMKTDRTIVPMILNHFDSCTYNIFITFFLRLFFVPSAKWSHFSLVPLGAMAPTLEVILQFSGWTYPIYSTGSSLSENKNHTLRLHPPFCSLFFGVSHFETKRDNLPHAPLRSLRFLRDIVSPCGAHQNGTQKGL